MPNKHRKLNSVEPRTFEFLSDFLLRVCDVCGEENENVRVLWTTAEPVFFCVECFQNAIEAALRVRKPQKRKQVDNQDEGINPLREL